MSSILLPHAKLYVPTLPGRRLMATGRDGRFGIIAFEDRASAALVAARLNAGRTVRFADGEWTTASPGAVDVLATCRKDLAKDMHAFVVHVCLPSPNDRIEAVRSYDASGDSLVAREILERSLARK